MLWSRDGEAAAIDATIDHHLRSVLGKLGTRSRAELVWLALVGGGADAVPA